MNLNFLVALRYVFGVFLLLIVVVIWVFSSVLIQTIFNELQYDQPLFLTYLNTGMFSLYIPLLILTYGLKWFTRIALKILLAFYESDIFRRSFFGQCLHGTQIIDMMIISKLRCWIHPAHAQDASRLNHEIENHFLTKGLLHESKSTIDSMPSPSTEDPLVGNPDINDSSLGERVDVPLDATFELLKEPPKHHFPRARKQVLYIFFCSCFLCPFWLWTNFAFNYSLKLTSITSNTILSSTSSTFCFLSGMILGIDTFSFTRIISIIFVFAGIVIIALNDQNEGVDTLIGDALAFGSAVSYGCYTSFLSFLLNPPGKHTEGEKQTIEASSKNDTDAVNHQSKNELINELPMENGTDYVQNMDKDLIQKEEYIGDGTKMMLLFGFIGIVNALTTWPFIILASLIGVESFRFIPNWTVAGALFLNGLIGTVLSDMLWAWSVLLSSPLIGTLGLSLTIPLASATDIIMGKNSFNLSFALGALLVAMGFIAANSSYFFPKKLKRIDSPSCLISKSSLYKLYWKRFQKV